MKKNNIDKIFQKKLLGKETLPSRQAWSKLENKLHHKRKKIVLFRYAAAITLLALTTFGIWLQKSEIIYPNDHPDKGRKGQIQILAQDVPIKKEAENMVDTWNSGKSEKNLIATIEPKNEEKKNESVPTESLKNQPKVTIKSEQRTNTLANTELPDINADHTLLVTDEVIPGPKEVLEKTEENIENNIYPKVTITFVRGVSSATNEIALITNDNEPAEQESKLKKLIQSAKELKLSDVNLAEIRETKDELFNLKPKLWSFILFISPKILFL
jgi:hypothetical protein